MRGMGIALASEKKTRPLDATTTSSANVMSASPCEHQRMLYILGDGQVLLGERMLAMPLAPFLKHSSS
jgi:hypothetical protein